MKTIFMNNENSKSSEPHRFKLDLTENLIIKTQTKTWIWPIWVFFTLGKTSIRIQQQKCKIPAPTWNDTFNLPDGSYSISDIQDYFEFIIKKHETLTENPPVQIYQIKLKTELFS